MHQNIWAHMYAQNQLKLESHTYVLYTQVFPDDAYSIPKGSISLLIPVAAEIGFRKHNRHYLKQCSCGGRRLSTEVWSPTVA